jgi:transposase
MRKLIPCDKPTIAALADRLKRASSHAEYQRIQCVLIRATLGSSAAQIAQLLGWSTATTHVLHTRWATEGESIFDARARGGRHHQYLTSEQEQKLLALLVERAQAGGILTLTQVQQAYQERSGKGRWRVRRSIDCWGDTAGAKWCHDPGIRKRTSRPSPPLKKLRPTVRQEVLRQAKRGRRLRLMLQEEARFGLLGTHRRCWTPHGIRPVVSARLERKYIYALSAVSPHNGVMDSIVLPWVNAHTMSLFLAEVAQRHIDEFVLMVTAPSPIQPSICGRRF